MEMQQKVCIHLQTMERRSWSAGLSLGYGRNNGSWEAQLSHITAARVRFVRIPTPEIT
jgi:hypothetical protein